MKKMTAKPSEVAAVTMPEVAAKQPEVAAVAMPEAVVAGVMMVVAAAIMTREVIGTGSKIHHVINLPDQLPTTLMLTLLHIMRVPLTQLTQVSLLTNQLTQVPLTQLTQVSLLTTPTQVSLPTHQLTQVSLTQLTPPPTLQLTDGHPWHTAAAAVKTPWRQSVCGARLPRSRSLSRRQGSYPFRKPG